MKRSGTADLKLMGGSIPAWLFERMVKLSLPIVQSIVLEYGQKEFLRKLSDPFWFQSFGAVIGMDWNSSGVTTAVMSALKKSLNPHAPEMGIFICGGKGKESLQTPQELITIGEKTGLNGDTDKQEAIKKLSLLAQKAESDFTPQDNLEALLNKEREDAWKYGGRTIHGLAKPS